MSSLTDLRSTLDQHAESVPDAEATARLTAVHHRVAAVRRRRRATGTAALALVLLAGVGTALVPRHDRDQLPAAPVVLGQRAPSTLSSLGYTYRTDGTAVSGDLRTTMKVRASDEPQLYSWTSSTPSTVRVDTPDDEVWHSHQGGFHDFVVVPPGTSGRLQVSVPEGRVALARYTLGDATPDGYTRNGLTYRQTVAGRPLLGAAVAGAGEVEATTTVTTPGGQVELAPLCTGVPRGYAVQVTVDGKGGLAGSCNDTSAFDPASLGGYSQWVGRPGHAVTVRIFLSRRIASAAPVAGSFPHLRLGVGVYGPLDQVRLAGNDVSRVLEHGGHTWTLAGTDTSGGRPLRLDAAGQDRLAWMVWGAKGTVRPSFAAEHTTPEGGTFGGGPAGIGDLWVPAGSGVVARLAHGKGPFGVATYTRAD
jgi:hypothetical protein